MNKKSTIGGFTLVEIIVSLAIFTVVSVVAVGALLKIVSANKKAQSIQNAITNLNFALESISREMRSGSKYYCSSLLSPSGLNGNNIGFTSQACSFGTGVLVAFKSSDYALYNNGNLCTTPAYNLVYAFRFKPSGSNYILEAARQNSKDCATPQEISDLDFQPMIPVKNITITGYQLGVISDSNHKYPLATIHIVGYAGSSEQDKTVFDVETSASARIP